MKQLIRYSALLLLGVCSGSLLLAQDSSSGITKNIEEKIIIRKKNNRTEKVTIVLDGDKMTVNGKPVDDFVSEDVEISRGEENPFEVPMPPGREMFNQDFMRELGGNKAFLGVMTRKTDDGAVITNVTDESPADKAGLKEDDVIIKVEKETVTGPDDLYKAIGKFKPKDKVSITYKRDGKENTIKAELEEGNQMRVFSFNNKGDNGLDRNFNFTMPEIPGLDGLRGFGGWDNKPRLGLQVQDTENGKGVKVLEAEEESAAENAGLKEDDIITKVNGKDINSVDDLKESIKDVKDGDTIKVNYLRDGKSQSVDVKFPKELKTIDL